jgi:MoCo/4Fe-4S cofactor protein with predicted Tat translocation signal
MTQFKKYWKGAEEINADATYLENQKDEFAESLPLDEVLTETNFELNSNRRDFLKYFGFSISAVALASCNKAPVKKAIPYLVKPEEVVPGNALFYNSTCGITHNPITVKVREGRPIKVDGNENDPAGQGGLSPQGQAGILSMYDKERLTGPKKVKNGEASDINWGELDLAIKTRLKGAQNSGKDIVIVSESINSPSTMAAINEFRAAYPSTKHITYDAVSYSGILDANQASFGKRVIPQYRFDNAEVIVSFGADFLSTWLNPVENTIQYSSKRVPTEDNKKMSRHIQFESLMTLTGSNADFRIPMMQSKEGLYLVTLYNSIAKKLGQPGFSAPKVELAMNSIENAAKELVDAKGKALVVSGSNNSDVQTMVNYINVLLESYGSTIDLDNHSNLFKGNDSDMEAFVSSMNKGNVGAVIFYDTNPVYSYYNSEAVVKGLKKVALKISTSMTFDETGKSVDYMCPDHHYLESWGDAEPRKNQYSFLQPTISNVFDTRQVQESLLTWSGYKGEETEDVLAKKGIMNQNFSSSVYYNFVRKTWKGMMALQSETSNFEKFWTKLIHDGIYGLPAVVSQPASFNVSMNAVASKLSSAKSNDIELVVYSQSGVGTGKHGNNPWLHEMPDPVTKVCWDNYVSLSKHIAEEHGISEGDVVNIKSGSYELTNMPVVIQPGQYRNTVGVSVGYGRVSAGKAGNGVGQNAYPFMSFNNTVNNISSVTVSKGDGEYELARTQTHHTFEGRNIVREVSLDAYKENSKAGNEHSHTLYSLWDSHDYSKGHHWAMAIDMNACTGCSACIVSCSIENNVPVVGRDEVRRRREMHWIRIDRYYSFAGELENEHGEEEGGHGHDAGDGFLTREKDLEKVEKKGNFDHWENVKVIHQPMLCQHCDNAPCETVCPVLATTHSTEGLNQMTYNRCIGTKYCANNCPYKVRRFNWFRYNDNDDFDFHFNNDLGKMVINPDVTVRTRGVMEKCSFCVQTIQTKKLEAKREGRALKDGDVKTACQKTCPANAIVFGDQNDPNSEVSKRLKNARNYYVLEEIDTKPSIGYMVKVRNSKETDKTV